MGFLLHCDNEPCLVKIIAPTGVLTGGRADRKRWVSWAWPAALRFFDETFYDDGGNGWARCHGRHHWRL
jgi:hypothetical protein